MPIDFTVMFIILVLTLGWFLDLTSKEPPGILAGVLCLWALPMAVTFHTFSSLYHKWGWEQYKKDMREIPEIVRESFGK